MPLQSFSVLNVLANLLEGFRLSGYAQGFTTSLWVGMLLSLVGIWNRYGDDRLYHSCCRQLRLVVLFRQSVDSHAFDHILQSLLSI